MEDDMEAARLGGSEDLDRSDLGAKDTQVP